MKVLVIKTYADKYTGETIEKGNTIEPKGERLKELLAAGVVKKIEKETK